eukprot:684307-Pleurochrysis_carterae.AAC.2
MFPASNSSLTRLPQPMLLVLVSLVAEAAATGKDVDVEVASAVETDKVVMWAARSPTAKTLTRLIRTRRLVRQVEDGFVMTHMRWTSVLVKAS